LAFITGRPSCGTLRAGVQNTGVKLDETPGKKYVAFTDPDRIACEFYMAQTGRHGSHMRCG
jgi:hypothetical protein